VNIKPILFSGEMISALLGGRKTQTRRVAEVTSDGCKPGFITPLAGFTPRRPENHISYCPYGKPGDLLWVRETWGLTNGSGIYVCESEPHVTKNGFHNHVFFRADYSKMTAWGMYGEPKWKPSIHMPRSASRLTLELTGVRVERLQEITTGDAWAEGCPHSDVGAIGLWFRPLWESISGTGSWDKNPWVWVLEFKVHKINIDQFINWRSRCSN
jgi:hypothetical protein